MPGYCDMMDLGGPWLVECSVAEVGGLVPVDLDLAKIPELTYGRSYQLNTMPENGRSCVSCELTYRSVGS